MTDELPGPRTPLNGSKLTRDQALGLYRQMCEIRSLEDKVNDLLNRDQIRGASHLYAGEEATAVGAISALREDDLVTSTHRAHGHFHARQDSLARTSEARQQHMARMLAELCGRSSGYCRGRGGSMHLADLPHGNLGATGIVGGNLPVAVGAALAARLRGQDRVVLCFFGDGAANTGNFHESLNMAAIWDLPVVFVCENNLYGMSAPFSAMSKHVDVAHRADAYGIPGEIVDGQDVLAVREAVLRAAERARSGQGPTLVECKTYRWFGHSRSDPRAYRSREEEAEWRERDCLNVMQRHLEGSGLTKEGDLDAVKVQAGLAVQHAVRLALGAPEPDAAELLAGVYAPTQYSPADVAAEREVAARVRGGKVKRSCPYWQALNEALREEMLRDPGVFVFGEDVGTYGGAYGVTRGLISEFGEKRVIDTPISEAAIAGAALGAAMAGMRPVAEIMYADFTTLAMDQLGNQAAKNRYMFGGGADMPLTVRTQGGVGRGGGAQHSQSLEALWVHLPGIKVVMPSTPYDAKGLLKAAIRDQGPVIFIEHKMLYGVSGPVPEKEYLIPLGSADVKRAGKDVTVVAYSRMALLALEAAETLAAGGVDVEVVDPRTLKPLDLETILASVRKTGRVVCVTEACRTGSFAAELASRIQEQAFDWLDAPVRIVAGADVPIPVAASLEAACIPRVEDIVAAVKEVMA
jgi:pyruvate/2-oxoglutarate/acetoin dehydrogenase E1 component/TPP-dependent pyruvate/acetoin dehydrogenase alpha subunit